MVYVSNRGTSTQGVRSTECFSDSAGQTLTSGEGLVSLFYLPVQWHVAGVCSGEIFQVLQCVISEPATNDPDHMSQYTPMICIPVSYYFTYIQLPAILQYTTDLPGKCL